MNNYFNPYQEANFGEFFLILGRRFWAFITGHLDFHELVSDEIQLLVLIAVALSCALLGVFLVLRKMTMLCNALSHTILLGIVLAYLMVPKSAREAPLNFQMMVGAAVGSGLLTSFLTQGLHRWAKVKEDASIGLVFTALFALGIVLVSCLLPNSHIGVEMVMGNVDALSLLDIGLAWKILLFNLLLLLLFYKEFVLTSFDLSYATSCRYPVRFIQYLLMVQLSATVIGAFRAVGVVMVLALLVGPALIGRLLAHRLKNLFLLAMGSALLSVFTGVALSRHLLTVYDCPLSTAGLTVLALSLYFGCALVGSSCKRLRKNHREHRGHREKEKGGNSLPAQ